MTAALHSFTPRGSAREVFECRAAEVLLAGPAGTGKSRAALEKLHQLMLINPGARGLMVRKTQASLSASGLVTFEKYVIPEAIADGTITYHGGSVREAPSYRYSNGSRILMAGLDKPTKIMSTEYDVIYVQEATEVSEEAWEMLTTRLRNGSISFQQLIADCNPDAPTHWLKQRADRGQTLMLESRHEENPVYFNEDGSLTDKGTAYIASLDNLTGVRYLRLRKGQWVGAEGMIYDEFDSTIHTIEPFQIPQDWARYWVVDFGYTNPFVLQRWAEDHDGRLYLYSEIYRTKSLVEDIAKDVLTEVTDDDGNWIEPRPSKIICDHDAEDRATLERHLGMPTTAANKTVSDGLQAVMARLRPAGDGKPRIFFVKNAVTHRDPDLVGSKPASTIEEMPGYIWNTDKDAPVKENDHGMDCIRYLVAAKDLVGQFRVRWLR